MTEKNRKPKQSAVRAKSDVVRSGQTVMPRGKVLDFYPEVALARAVLVVDEELMLLVPLLEDLRFRVFTLRLGLDGDRLENPTMADEETGRLLCQRVLVTRRGDRFRHAAAVHEFSIVEGIDYLEDLSGLALDISRHWMQLRLRERQPFVLRLQRNGSPILEQVE